VQDGEREAFEAAYSGEYGTPISVLRLLREGDAYIEKPHHGDRLNSSWWMWRQTRAAITAQHGDTPVDDKSNPNREHLEPCPFCGGGRQQQSSNGHESNLMVCECGAEGPPGEDDIEAIDRWNARAQAKAAPQAEPASRDAAEYQQFSRYGNWERIEKAIFDLGLLGQSPERFRALYAHPPAPDAELVRQCIADELAEWTGDNRVIIEHAMRDLTARIDAKLAQLRTKGE
jgi:Lar family restriction alleviation protein